MDTIATLRTKYTLIKDHNHGVVLNNDDPNSIITNVTQQKKGKILYFTSVSQNKDGKYLNKLFICPDENVENRGRIRFPVNETVINIIPLDKVDEEGQLHVAIQTTNSVFALSFPFQETYNQKLIKNRKISLVYNNTHGVKNIFWNGPKKLWLFNNISNKLVLFNEEKVEGTNFLDAPATPLDELKDGEEIRDLDLYSDRLLLTTNFALRLLDIDDLCSEYYKSVDGLSEATILNHDDSIDDQIEILYVTNGYELNKLSINPDTMKDVQESSLQFQKESQLRYFFQGNDIIIWMNNDTFYWVRYENNLISMRCQIHFELDDDLGKFLALTPTINGSVYICTELKVFHFELDKLEYDEPIDQITHKLEANDVHEQILEQVSEEKMNGQDKEKRQEDKVQEDKVQEQTQVPEQAVQEEPELVEKQVAQQATQKKQEEKQVEKQEEKQEETIESKQIPSKKEIKARSNKVASSTKPLKPTKKKLKIMEPPVNDTPKKVSPQKVVDTSLEEIINELKSQQKNLFKRNKKLSNKLSDSEKKRKILSEKIEKLESTVSNRLACKIREDSNTIRDLEEKIKKLNRNIQSAEDRYRNLETKYNKSLDDIKKYQRNSQQFIDHQQSILDKYVNEKDYPTLLDELESNALDASFVASYLSEPIKVEFTKSLSFENCNRLIMYLIQYSEDDVPLEWVEDILKPYCITFAKVKQTENFQATLDILKGNDQTKLLHYVSLLDNLNSIE